MHTKYDFRLVFLATFFAFMCIHCCAHVVVQSAGKTADKLADAVTSLYFPAVHHQGKVMDFIESNNELHGGCPVAGMS